MSKVILSYTAIDNIHKASHTWICKTLGIETPTSEAMTKGKEAHAKIKAHVSGKTKIEGLDLPMDFPKIEYHAQKPYNDTFSFHGYCDGVNFASKSILEVKTSGSKIWSQGDFDKSMQPVYYSFVTQFRNVYLVTCKFDLSGLKVYTRQFTNEDWKRAEKWANEAIEIIEKSDFKGGLDESGRCLGWKGGCNYGENCYFA